MKMLNMAPSALALSALLALSSTVPALAAPVQQTQIPVPSNLEMVQYKAHAGYWRGSHGSRTDRPGTRRHSDGFWYPLAAFGVEAGITGSIVREPENRPEPKTMCNPTFSGSIGPGSMPCDNGY